MSSSCMADPRTFEDKPIRAMAASSSGYNCYSDNVVVSSNSHMVSHLQSFEQNPAEMYNLTAGMEMIGFPPKPASNEYYNHHGLSGIADHHHANWSSNNLGCVFTCEGNERPSQGLSLSLSSSNPSRIGLQSFELRQGDDFRFGPSSSRSHVSNNIQHEEQPQVMMQGQFLIRESKYLGPAQDLLYEFCNLGTKHDDFASKGKHRKASEGCEDDQINAVRKQSLYSLDFLELQRRKARLLQMVDEVDRRYKHYCNQMKSLVSSFEAVAGEGAATVYSAMASRAMSRHFRCLRDGIVNQIKLTKKAMGDKDTAAPGTIKGETPRLRLLDQSLRQQRAIQQISMMESHPWRPQRGLPERSVSVLRAWLFEHFLHPYPSDVDKHILARQTGLSRSQVSNWFINARVRLWKPMVEEMYLEELKEQEGATGENDQNNPNHSTNEDQKPTHDQLVRIDSECLSSIISNAENNMNNQQKYKGIQNDHHHHHQHQQQQQQHSFGSSSYCAMELDFSPYGTHQPSAGGGGGVSLTLGLHQHHGASNGANLAFSQGAAGASQGPSMFYARDHHNNMEDCQTVHYSLLDSDGQTLPYRNLMEAQLLHDLAG